MRKNSAFIGLQNHIRAVEAEIESKDKVIVRLRDCLEESLEDSKQIRKELVIKHGKSDQKGFIAQQDEFLQRCASAIEESKTVVPEAG